MNILSFNTCTEEELINFFDSAVKNKYWMACANDNTCPIIYYDKNCDKLINDIKNIKDKEIVELGSIDYPKLYIKIGNGDFIKSLFEFLDLEINLI